MRILFTGLLAAAFVLSSSVMVSLMMAHSSDYGAIGELLLVAVLSLEGIVAVSHLWESRLEAVHGTLVTLYQDYRSPEMLLAISALWKLRREHPTDFVQEYMATWEREEKEVAAVSRKDRIEVIVTTMHHQRRTVKLFYDFLAVGVIRFGGQLI
jgi:hypothetical protein